MEALLIWSLQSSIILGVLYLAYLLLFKSNSRAELKRGILLSILVCAVTFPTLKVNLNLPSKAISQSLAISSFDISSIAPTQTETSETKNHTIIADNESSINWWGIAGNVYLLGVLISFTILIMEVYRIGWFMRSGQKGAVLNRKVIFHKSIKSPFSFLKWIFLPEDVSYSNEAWMAIKTHEEAHINQLHTLDLFLSRLFQVFIWYNPFCYWFSKTMKLNHEVLADSEALKTVNLKTYTQILLNISLSQSDSSLGHSMALRSSLSNRIVLMKTQKTNTMKTVRNLLTFLLIGTVVFLQTSAYAQFPEHKSTSLFGNGTLFFAGGGKYVAFNSLKINERFGKTPDGWIKDYLRSSYTPIVLLEERKDLIREIAKQQDDEQFLETAFLEMSSTENAGELMKSPMISFSSKKHTTIKLSTEELVAMYDLSKNWFNNYIKPIYPEQKFISEPEFLKNKFMIIFTPNHEPFPFNSSERVLEVSEVDMLPSPKGGLERFINNILKEASSSTDLSVLNEDVAFNLIVGMNGNVSHLELVSEVAGDEPTQDKKFEALGAINKQILSLSNLYGWNSAKKADRRVAANYRLEIPKTSF